MHTIGWSRKLVDTVNIGELTSECCVVLWAMLLMTKGMTATPTSRSLMARFKRKVDVMVWSFLENATVTTTRTFPTMTTRQMRIVDIRSTVVRGSWKVSPLRVWLQFPGESIQCKLPAVRFTLGALLKVSAEPPRGALDPLARNSDILGQGGTLLAVLVSPDSPTLVPDTVP